jgi:hypothetical protein
VYSNRGSKIDPLADIFRTIPVRAVEKGPASGHTANQKCKKSKTLASSPPGVKIGPKNVQGQKMAILAVFGSFLDITRLVGLVIGSNLVQTASNTCAGLCEVL